MAKEREITILDIDPKEVVRRLRQLKAKRVGTYKFKRMEFLLGGNIKGSHSWVRVRTDGKETTITLKELKKAGGYTPMNEYEVKASDFRETIRIMSKLTTSKLLYFENDRQAYQFNGSYVTIDKWPMIPAFVEIESPSVKKLKQTYKMLKIKGKFAGNASIHKVYELYGLKFREVMAKNQPKLKKLLGRQ